MSTINTNGIDGNYPTPGQNNSSEGFRNNFTAIKTNLNTASTEITELQDKAVLKQGLNNLTLDNNMANTLISNAAIRTFRNTMYNLGNNVSGTVIVNCTLGDVQTATITGDTTFQFAGWAPTATRHTITLDLTIANTTANINFPSEVSQSENILENNTQDINGNLVIATAPYNAGQLVYDLSTIDCGNSILITPTNRSYQTSQIEERVAMTPTGYQGDRNGDIAVESSVQPVTVTASESAGDTLTTSSTAGFYLGMPIQFYGVVFGNIVAGTTYYVRTIVANTSFTVSATPGGGNFALADQTLGTMQAKPVSYVYMSVGTYNSTATVDSIISTTATADQVEFNSQNSTIFDNGLNQPVVFAGATIDTANTNIQANTTYYVKSLDNSGANLKMSISRTRTNGVADANVTLGTVSSFAGNVTATVYNQGNDIWKRVTLDSF